MSTKTAKVATPAPAATTNLTAPPAVKKVVKPAAAPAAAEAAPAPAPVPVAAPAKKAAAPKKEEVVAPVSVAAPAVAEVAPVVAEAAEAAAPAESSTGGATEAGAIGAASEEKLKSVVARVNELLDTLKAVATELKVLQKQVGKDFKEAAKASRTRRGKRGGAANGDKAKRSPSGFAKPTDLSAELCTFLGVDAGTQLARTEVTKKITEYIKTNSLQNQANKKIIIPDATLGKLLNNNGEEVTYFNLQKFLKVHFTKTA